MQKKVKLSSMGLIEDLSYLTINLIMKLKILRFSEITLMDAFDDQGYVTVCNLFAYFKGSKIQDWGKLLNCQHLYSCSKKMRPSCFRQQD